MAFKTKIETKFGEKKEVYARINNIEASNHGIESTILVRFFLSKEAFKKGSHYIDEKYYRINIDVSKPIWEQSYNYLKTLEEFEDIEDY